MGKRGESEDGPICWAGRERGRSRKPGRMRLVQVRSTSEEPNQANEFRKRRSLP